jgi:hypothetical protein
LARAIPVTCALCALVRNLHSVRARHLIRGDTMKRATLWLFLAAAAGLSACSAINHDKAIQKGEYCIPGALPDCDDGLKCDRSQRICIPDKGYGDLTTPKTAHQVGEKDIGAPCEADVQCRLGLFCNPDTKVCGM